MYVAYLDVLGVKPDVNIQWGYHMTKTVQTGDALSISEILYIENLIGCCIETSLIPI